MKLDPNCVRDILLTIESNEFGVNMSLNSLHEKLSNYTKNEIHYTCIKLKEANLLEVTLVPVCGQSIPILCSIGDLTYDGHEFLSNIKNDTNWNKTKEIAKSVGSFSLNTLKEISVSVLSELIKSKI